jgi:hypothetical protein
MKNKNNLFKISLVIFAALVFISGCGKLKSLFGDKDRLYFCERYDTNDGEINESSKFTTGTLTVMIKLSKPIGVNSVNINITDIKKNEVVQTIPFTVTPSMTYIYFEKVAFENPGNYKVSCLKTDGTVIVTGEIEIVK